MKALNFIDLCFQTLVLGIVALSSVAFTIGGKLEGIIMMAMYGALFLGPWQFVSSLVTCLSRGLFLRWRLIHLGSSIGYMALVALAAFLMDYFDRNGVLWTIGGVFAFAIPTVLAVFYYYITIKSFQFERTQARLKKVKA